MQFDVVIVGGGPGGLAAALTLGRARKRVLLCDAGPRRNAAATHIHNFVTRDGTPPDEFRRVGREQLAHYPTVTVRDAGVRALEGERGAFRVTLDGGTAAEGVVEARRVLLCTGMVDEPLPLEGFSALWGRSIFQCPYCHGFEAQDRRWGVLVSEAHAAQIAPFALQALGWTPDVTVFTNGVALPPAVHAALAGVVTVEEQTIARLNAKDGQLHSVALADGRAVACDVLFAHPPQRQVKLVASLGLGLDEHGFVAVDPMRRETSVPGIYAAGDLTSRMQAAVAAAAAAMQCAAMINVDLALDNAARAQATQRGAR